MPPLLILQGYRLNISLWLIALSPTLSRGEWDRLAGSPKFGDNFKTIKFLCPQFTLSV